MEGAETAAMGLVGTGITATHGLTTFITVITMYIIATAASTILTIILDVGGFCPVGLGNETAGVLEEGCQQEICKNTQSHETAARTRSAAAKSHKRHLKTPKPQLLDPMLSHH